MPRTRFWMLALLALGALSCRSADPPGESTGKPAGEPAAATPPAAPAAPRPADPAPAFVDLDPSLGPGLDALRARFQEDDGMVRVIMLVAPT